MTTRTSTLLARPLLKATRFRLAGTVLLLAATSHAQAGLIKNGGFELGLLDWLVPNPTLISTVFSFDGKSPIEGNFFALLSSGVATNTYTTLSQDFTANVRQTLSLNAFFRAGDYLPYNDDGYVRLINKSTATPLMPFLFSQSVATVGNYGSTPWTNISYTFQSSGSYRIEAAVRNVSDNAAESYLGLDKVVLQGVSVPEPASLALLGIGWIGIGFVRRRRG